MNPIYLQFFISVFLLVNVRQLFLSKKMVLESEKPYPKYMLIMVGALASFITWITGTVGLPFNRFYLKYGLSKEEILATKAENEIILHVIKLALYYFVGLFSAESVQMGVVIATGPIISSFTIRHIWLLPSEITFRKIGYVAMTISGIVLLINTDSSFMKLDNPSIPVKPFSLRIGSQLAFRKTHIAIEIEYNEGIHIEHQITMDEIHEKLHPRIELLTLGAEEDF